MPQVIDKLVSYSWPGNVRELENVIERMMVTASGEELNVNLVPETIWNKTFSPKRGAKLKDAVEQTEIYLLSASYKEYGSWQKVAEKLGVDRTTVFRKVIRYGLGKK